MNRGARRSPVLATDEQAGLFLTYLAESSQRFDLEVHAYAVMPNHYHLLARSARGNLSRAMRHIGASFTLDLNRRHNWDGPVFRGRFKSQLITDELHLLTIATYIHLNPIRAKIVKRLDQHCWTSHRAYLGLDVPPEWLHREVVQAVAGGAKAFAQHAVDLRTGRERWPSELNLETGWLSEERGTESPVKPRPTIKDRSVSAETMPLGDVIRAVLEITGGNRSRLRSSRFGPGGNPVRRFAAWALARTTQLTQREIGSQVDMTPGHVAMTLRRVENSPGDPVAGWIDLWLAKYS